MIGNIFLYYEQGNSGACRSPDVMVVKGVPANLNATRSRPGRKSAALPGDRIDLEQDPGGGSGPEKELYQQLAAREYFLFDPLGDYLPRPLVGYRLIHRAGDNGNGLISEYEESASRAGRRDIEPGTGVSVWFPTACNLRQSILPPATLAHSPRAKGAI